MKFEDLQNQWQKEGGDTKVQVSYDMLLKEIKRNKTYFDAMIFWRDVRETVVGIALIVIFSYFGVKFKAWPLFLLSGCFLFVCLFLFIDRIRYRKKTFSKGDDLKSCIENSLVEVNHQIWLLRNVFWWYLLPLLLGMIIFFSYVKIHRYIKHTLLHETKTVLEIIWPLLGEFLLLGLMFAGVYWLNQWAVRKELLPRKEEFENVLRSLENNQ